MINISTETRGVDRVQSWYRERAATLRGASKTVELYFNNPSRNATIAAAQANQDRNPFFTTPQEQRQLTQLVSEGVFDALRTNNAQRLVVRLNEVGESMVRNAQAHIARRQSGGVPPVPAPTTPHKTKPLTETYAKWKRKKYGSAVPELFATGEFKNSFLYRLRR